MAAAGDLTAQCPTYNRAAEIIGSRWAGAVVRAMLAGATRFSEIRDYINGITDRVLSKRLKDLESEGILVRKVFNDTPIRIEYHLTDKGRALARVVDAMTEWADEWLIAPAVAQDSGAGNRNRDRRMPAPVE